MSALLPSILLVILGWRLLQQESALEERQQQETREQAADLVVSALLTDVTRAEEALQRDTTYLLLDGSTRAVVISRGEAGLRVMPRPGVLYVPEPMPLAEVRLDAFDAADRVEYQDGDPDRALKLLQSLAASNDRRVQAGAFLAIGRIQRHRGRFDEAIAAYREGYRFDDIAMHGIPVGLHARRGTCSVYEAARQIEPLRREASDLEHRLLDGTWTLTLAIFDAQLEDLTRWLGREPAVTREARAISDAIATVWRRWRGNRDGARSARENIPVDGTALTVIARGDERAFAALIAPAEYVEERWLGPARHRVRPGLAVRVESASENGRARPAARRSASDTGLPWTVIVAGSDQQIGDVLARRRALWLAGFAVMLVIILLGTYVLQGLVARQLAIARLQSDFVAAVSHEFRTPLTSLRQLSEMLIDGAEPPADRRLRYYEALQRQTDRLQRLVERLLDFSRFESGRAAYARQLLECTALATQVVAEFRDDAAARGHRVDVKGPVGAWMCGDPEALRHALWNLLDNAAKYSPPSQPIVVEIEAAEGDVRVSIRDQGPGIPRNEQARIFEKFVRGEHARHNGVSGTGIGLAMVRQIVRAHEGSISVDSAPGEGAVFTMCFRAASAPINEEVPCLGS